MASCRMQLENELCDLFDEMGPALVQAAIDRGKTSRDQGKKIAASTLKQALATSWGRVPHSLNMKLAARKVTAVKSDYGSSNSVSLQLLSEAEESIQLAVRDVLDHLLLACREESRPLERRVNFLVLRTAMQPGDTSFKIPSLWSCIEAVCAEVTANTHALILLLQLVGEQLAREMPQLYRLANETFIEAGILPQLKRNYRDATQVDAHEVAEESTKLASTLDRLVQIRTQAARTETSHSANASQELFHSLNSLQTDSKPSTAGTHTNVVRMVRDSGGTRNVKPLEAVTVDIVAELFDLIFNDPKVSDGIKALVARLQATVLRAAMLNQRFFADRSHPARRGRGCRSRPDGPNSGPCGPS